jgi:hypothetical protein
LLDFIVRASWKSFCIFSEVISEDPREPLIDCSTWEIDGFYMDPKNPLIIPENPSKSQGSTNHPINPIIHLPIHRNSQNRKRNLYENEK